MATIIHEGKVLLEKTTRSRNKFTGNITLTDEEVDLIARKQVYAVVVYKDKNKTNVKAIIKHPWNYVNNISKPNGYTYSLMSYEGHTI